MTRHPPAAPAVRTAAAGLLAGAALLAPAGPILAQAQAQAQAQTQTPGPTQTAVQTPGAAEPQAPTAAATAAEPPAPAAGTAPRPGLWEQQVQLTSPDPQLAALIRQAPALLAALPPEQRQRLDQLAARQGLALDMGQPRARLCLAAGDLAAGRLPTPQPDCTQTVQRHGAQREVWQVQLQCPASPGRPAGSGQGTLTWLDAERYQGQFSLEARGASRSLPLRLDVQGRWLSADCGALRPLGQGHNTAP